MVPMAATERDTQRQRLYDAENTARATWQGPCRTWQPGQYQQVQRYVNNLLGQQWVRRTWPHAPRSLQVDALPGSVNALAHWTRGRITLPQGKGGTSAAWAWTEWVVLHEVAHHLDDHGGAHGWGFAKAFLRLVRNRMGQDAEAHLRAAFRSRRVRYTAPRTLTPEQRAAAAERLAVGREAALAKAHATNRARRAQAKAQEQLVEDTSLLCQHLSAQLAMAWEPAEAPAAAMVGALTGVRWERDREAVRLWSLPRPQVAAVTWDGKPTAVWSGRL